MILAHGKVYDSDQQEEILDGLEEIINATRASKRLDVDRVISAIDALGRQLEGGGLEELLDGLSLDGAAEQARAVLPMLRRETLEYKLDTELGRDFFRPRASVAPNGLPAVRTLPMPLGTLLHIAAGNVDGLPLYSAAEGLLTGNVNLLKLPQADNGLSIRAALRLMELEPSIADFLYIFDTPSTDLPALQKLAAMSDGIVVWGGDAAVAAARRLAPPGVKLIEWGHRLSFAYLSGWEGQTEELSALARHIVTTRQLLCSSCQVIYLDTEDKDELRRFCEVFLPLLDRAAKNGPPESPGAAAERTLRRYSDQVEGFLSGTAPSGERQRFQGERCSLTLCPDSTLELSDLFGNPLVKPLPRAKIFSALRPHKGYLQTVGLLCPPEDRPVLAEQFAACGLTRVTRPGSMSDVFAGEGHDGEYPLRRYVRMVDVEL